jgi:hypothetical protein
MNKIKLYHSCKLETLKSISKHGLLKSPLDNLIYFCDNDDSSIKWIEWREELRDGIKLKELGIVIFETTLDDPNLSISTYHNPILFKMLDIQGTSYCYSKSIHPSKLTFQKVRIDENYFEYYDKEFNEKFQQPSNRLINRLMKNSIDNIVICSKQGKCHFYSSKENECFNPDFGWYYYKREPKKYSSIKQKITQSENP